MSNISSDLSLINLKLNSALKIKIAKKSSFAAMLAECRKDIKNMLKTDLLHILLFYLA